MKPAAMPTEKTANTPPRCKCINMEVVSMEIPRMINGEKTVTTISGGSGDQSLFFDLLMSAFRVETWQILSRSTTRNHFGHHPRFGTVPSRFRARRLHTFVSMTFDEVVVDHPCGLHECVTDGRADERETALAQGFAHRIRLLCH